MVALAADLSSERAAEVPIGAKTFQHVKEIILGLPAELFTRELIDVDAIELREHFPLFLRVELRKIGKVASHDGRSAAAKCGEIVAREGSGGGDDEAAELENRRFFDGEKMGADDVFDIDTAVEEFVGLGVCSFVSRGGGGIVVGFGEKARSAKDEDWQAALAGKKFADVFGGDLGDAVNVSGNGRTSSVIQAAGWPGAGVRAEPKALVVLVKMKDSTFAATAASRRFRVPVMFVSTNS